MLKRYLLAPGLPLCLQRHCLPWQCRLYITVRLISSLCLMLHKPEVAYQTKTMCLSCPAAGTGGMVGAVNNFSAWAIRLSP